MRILNPISTVAITALCLLADGGARAQTPINNPGTSTNTMTNLDLRPVLREMGLVPRRQGNRPTCSVFTVTAAVEFALAKRVGHTPRMSVEFLNWAACQACGRTKDGGFFSDLWRGFEKSGICAEEAMPYQASFNPAVRPSSEALTEAKTRAKLGLSLNWIKRWDVTTGLTPGEFNGIRQTLAQGWPVCSGLRWPTHARWVDGVLQMCNADQVFDGHSILVVGCREDPAQPGGGVLIFRNTSGDGHDGLMPYAYARLYMNDAASITVDKTLKTTPATESPQPLSP